MPLARFLARSGIASRRECERLIAEGAISVNGAPAGSAGQRVDPKADKIRFGKRVLKLQPCMTFLLHKPSGYTCSNKDSHAEKLAIDLLPAARRQRLFSIGRLDRDSEGLLLFTNDGELAQKLAHPRFKIPKTYRVSVSGKLRQGQMRRMEQGIRDRGQLLQADSARIQRQTRSGGVLSIRLSSGRKREVRRLCDRCGYRVRRLIRTQFGPLRLGKFQPGHWRRLSSEEIDALYEAAES